MPVVSGIYTHSSAEKKTGKKPGVARQKLPDAEQKGCPGQTQERAKLKMEEHPGV